MIALLFTLLCFVSAIYFPWIVTCILVLVTALFEPLVPLALGIFADLLYWSPAVNTLPNGTLCGLGATAIAFFVRSRLRTGSMR